MRGAFALVVTAWLVLACGGTAATSAPTTAPTVASTTPRPTPSPAPATTPLPGCIPDCDRGKLTRPGALAAGDYKTRHFFGEQLTVTVPDGYSSEEDSSGELDLRNDSVEGASMKAWLDIFPIIDGSGADPVEGVEPTADGILSWVESNPNVTVTEREPANIGPLVGEAIEIVPSDDAVNVDPGCPPEVKPCVGLFGSRPWGPGEFFSEGGPFHLRLVVADATWGGEPHVVAVLIDAENDDAYADAKDEFIAITEGAKMPLGVAQD